MKKIAKVYQYLNKGWEFKSADGKGWVKANVPGNIHLDLINNVLRRLREDQVVTVNGTDYSSLIGDLVNDAKKVVENSFDWTALRDAITISTASGTS